MRTETRSFSLKWLIALGFVATTIAGAGRVNFRDDREKIDAEFRRELLTDADSLQVALQALKVTLIGENNSGANRAALVRARMPYKRMEPIIEFYAPALAAAFNSRRQEVDDEDAPPPSSLAPTGFPALESIVFSGLRRDGDSLRADIDIMVNNVGRIRSLLDAVIPTDAQRFEIVRLELIRIATLGIAGFDTPASHEAMTESAEAVASLTRLIPVVAKESPQGDSLREALRNEARYLREHAAFDAFNRLEFLAFRSEPTLAALLRLRDMLHVTPMTMPRALRASAASPFQAGAFDVMAYAPRNSPRPTPALIALGETLFSDTRLSGNQMRSCASCHIPGNGFTDGLVRASSIRNYGSKIARHTPTLLNAALHPRQFVDERAVSLEDQVLLVLANKDEMASSVELAVNTLASDVSYRLRFARAFGTVDTTSVTPRRLQQALAAYVRSLVSLNSRFDRAVRGDTAQLSAEEQRGFNLFMGKATCGTCHFAPLFNGTTPPLFVNSDVEVIGTPRSSSDFSQLDADSGRAGIDHLDLHYRAFRTPTVRNAGILAPFMHNGVFRSLTDVLRFYNGGGGAGAGANISNQTLAADSLHLTNVEQHAVIAFLKSLTDSPLAVAHR